MRNNDPFAVLDRLSAGGPTEPGRPLAYLRGSRVSDHGEVAQRSARQYGSDELSYRIGLTNYPHASLYEHLLFIGSPGTGKTTLINQVKREVLQAMNEQSSGGDRGEHKVFIWDFKGDERRYLDHHRHNFGFPVHYLNPLDARGMGVDITSLVVDRVEANEFAADLINPGISEGGGSTNSDFTYAARALFSQVVQTFQEKARDEDGRPRWRFIDVLEACQSEESLRRVLSLTRRGQAKAAEILGAPKQAKGVMFTLIAAVEDLWPLACAMLHVDENISLSAWVQSESSVLVLQHVDRYRHSLMGWEKWVFGQLVKLVLSQPDTKTGRYVFFLDEVRQGPFGDHLARLAAVGRSKGVAMVVGLQDIEGLKDMMNPQRAAEFLAVCSTQVFFQTNNPETAEWVSKRIGKQTVLLPAYSLSSSRNVNTNAPDMSQEEFDFEVLRHLFLKDILTDQQQYFTSVRDAKAVLSEFRAKGETVRAVLENPLSEAYHGTKWPFRAGQSYMTENRDLMRYAAFGILPPGFTIDRSASISENRSLEYKEQEQDTVTPAEIMSLPKAVMTDDGRGLVITAYVVSPIHGIWKEVAHQMDDKDVTMTQAQSGVIPFQPRSPENLDYDGWDITDETDLGLYGARLTPSPTGDNP